MALDNEGGKPGSTPCGSIPPVHTSIHPASGCFGDEIRSSGSRHFDRFFQDRRPARSGHLPAIANMDSLHKLLAVAALGVMAVSATAQQVSREEVKGLDEQVQDIKKDTLAISSELQQLEEKLLYPSSTQLSLFVSMRGTGKLRLDAVRLKVDGEEAAAHIYSFKELEALEGGGVQRLHTGNVRTGEHSVEVSVVGKAGGADFQQVATYKFKKSAEPKLLEIIVDRSGSSGSVIQFKE